MGEGCSQRATGADTIQSTSVTNTPVSLKEGACLRVCQGHEKQGEGYKWKRPFCSPHSSPAPALEFGATKPRHHPAFLLKEFSLDSYLTFQTPVLTSKVGVTYLPQRDTVRVKLDNVWKALSTVPSIQQVLNKSDFLIMKVLPTPPGCPAETEGRGVRPPEEGAPGPLPGPRQGVPQHQALHAFPRGLSKQC